MEEDVQDKSQMLVIVLFSHNIKTLLKQTLAVQIIRESEYSPSKIVSKFQSIHENVNGKNKSFSEDLQEMIVMLVKVLSTFDPTKPTTTKDAPTPWNISLENFLSIHQPTILHNLDDQFITKICSSLADLEDDIIDTFPSLRVFEVTDGVLSKLPYENRHTQREAIEGLITALLIDITEEIKPNYEKLITATIVSSGAILESLDVVNRQRNKSVHGESFPTSSELTHFVKEYSNCVRYFIGEIKCYPYADEHEMLEKYLNPSPSTDQIQMIIDAYDKAIYSLGKKRPVESKEMDPKTVKMINLLAKEQHGLWKKSNMRLKEVFSYDIRSESKTASADQ